MQSFERVPQASPDLVPESEQSVMEQDSKLPSPLTGDEILEWAKRNNFGKEETAPKGQLITQGDKSDFVYVVLGAGAKVEHTVYGKQYYLTNLPSHSVVGEISALTEGLPTASVYLEWPTQVLQIAKEDFRKITEDPNMKERIELLVQKRLLMSAQARQELMTHLEEIEAERMHETPNSELKEVLSFQGALQAGLAEGRVIRRDFKICRILGKSLEAEDFTVEYSPAAKGRYNVEIYGGDTTIPLTFSADGKSVATGQVEMGERAGGGLYSRILRYTLQGVERITAQINEKNTKSFLKMDARGNEDISHAELAAHSPVVAARKSFISTINDERQLDSYRVDTTLALILDISTDVERALLEGTDKRLVDIYGTSKEETLFQLRDLAEDYRQSSEYEALPQAVRSICDLQFKRIEKLSEQ